MGPLRTRGGCQHERPVVVVMAVEEYEQLTFLALLK